MTLSRMYIKWVSFPKDKSIKRQNPKENVGMADTTTTITQVEPEHPKEQRVQQRFPIWHRLALVGIILISVFMDFYRLGQNGFGSYYPPAVRSMMDSWHNFFFASYYPGGFVTIDKPPVGFWFEVARSPQEACRSSRSRLDHRK